MDKYTQDFGPIFTEHVANTMFNMIRVDEGTFIMGHTFDQFDSEQDIYYRESFIYGTNEQRIADRSWGFSTRPHPVTVPCFYISEVPVTQKLWNAIMGVKPDNSAAFDDTPVQVYPKEARLFLNRISEITNRHYYLPTEEQWEYAARGGCRSKGYRYAGSNRHDDVCLKKIHNENATLSPVRLFPPNELGIYDMTNLYGEICMRTYEKFPDFWEVAPLPEKEVELVCRGITGSSFYDFVYEETKYAFRVVLRLERTSPISLPRINFKHMRTIWYGRNGILHEIHANQMECPPIRKQPEGTIIPPGKHYSEHVGSIRFKMIHVEGGTFTLPNHKCTITLNDYYLASTPVTQELWDEIMGVGYDRSTLRSPQCPVNKVRFFECKTFFRKLNKLTGRHYVLPSSAQWYWASLGGHLSKGYKYIGSDIKEEISHYEFDENKLGYLPHNVAVTKPNELGLFDMADNVQEWLADGEEPLPEDDGHYTDPIWYNKTIYYNMLTRYGSEESEPVPNQGFLSPINMSDISETGIRIALEP